MSEFNTQSSDLTKKVSNPFATYNVYEGTVTMPTPLNISYATGYGAYVETAVSALNFGIQVPEVSAVYYFETNLGSGITQYDHRSMPFTNWDNNGNISELAYMTIYYQAAVKTSPLSATSKLVFWYYNRTSSTGGQKFYYKLKSTNALPG